MEPESVQGDHCRGEIGRGESDVQGAGGPGGDRVSAAQAVGRGNDRGLAVGVYGRGVAARDGGGAARWREEGDPAARDRLAERAHHGDGQGSGEGRAHLRALVIAARHDESEAAGLEGADVGSAPLGSGDSTLVGGDAGNGCAGVDGRAAGEQGIGEGRTSVIGQQTEQRVGVDEISGIEAEAGSIGEEVVAQGVKVAGRATGDVPTLRVLEDAVDGRDLGVRPRGDCDATPGAAGVAAGRIVGDRGVDNLSGTGVEDAAAGAGAGGAVGRIAAEGGASDHQQGGVEDATAGAGGGGDEEATAPPVACIPQRAEPVTVKRSPVKMPPPAGASCRRRGRRSAVGHIAAEGGTSGPSSARC